MNDFAESGQDEESDRHAHVHVEKYMEEMRLYYAERDDLWIGMALGATEGVRKDLTNDRLESAVAVNIVTKEEIFRRFGDEDETPLQEENREMIKDPHNTALVHNHWNDSPGSQADFDAALWLGVRYLIVVTPSGMQYIYERDGDTMKLLDAIFNREHVALPSPAETKESRAAYEAQLLAEAGNPAERVMRQGDEHNEENTIDTNSRFVREFLLDPATVVFLDDLANEYGVEDPSFYSAAVSTIIYRELTGFASLQVAGIPFFQTVYDTIEAVGNVPSYLLLQGNHTPLPKLDGDPSAGIGGLNREAVMNIERDSRLQGMTLYIPDLGFDIPKGFGDYSFSLGEQPVRMAKGDWQFPEYYSSTIIPPSNVNEGAWRSVLPRFADESLVGLHYRHEPTLGYIAAEVAIAMRSTVYQALETGGERIAFLIGNHANRSAKPEEVLYNPQRFSDDTYREISWAEDFEELGDKVRNEIQMGTQNE